MGPTCNVPYDPCVGEPCLNGATCNKEKEERGSGDEYSCVCVPGFEGVNCQDNTNDCLNVDCPTNQTCVDLLQAYECRCPPGLQGEFCTEETDECADSPCDHGGVCTNLPGAGHRCDCAPGYTGADCSQDVDECEDEEICNKGICRNTMGSFECFCRPGYTGTLCNHEFDECLSNPCQHGNCTNRINNYECDCLLGFEGNNCEVDIDECEPRPCLNGATCIDGVGGKNNYTCICQPGYDGRNCSIDIDDCLLNPCLHNGKCEDGVNMFTCNCSNTGYTGDTCDIDIDECEVNPCQHNSTCNNLINNYSCNCWDGYTGKNCEKDIQECDLQPCQNNASCYEYSNQTLYSPDMMYTLPDEIKSVFSREFSYSEASGYLCHCLRGFEGAECQTNINECAGNPCLNGAECVDGIAKYTCQCLPGFEGDRCETNIDECAVYQPCQNGAHCMDRINDYTCQCQPNYGGKNCSVLLTGCNSLSCFEGGTCIPYLVGETDQRFNCTCMPGFDGERCQLTTTMSFKGDSFVRVNSTREEGFELFFRFRTTLRNGLIAIGQGSSFFSLQLKDGRLNLHSAMLSVFEGLYIGENLSNTEWQKVYISVNMTHLTIALNDGRLQILQPINPDNPSQTAFQATYLGGSDRTSRVLAAPNPTPFVGCIQDISVNGLKVTEIELRSNPGAILEQNTEKGCIRKDQCNPNPCMNDGLCTDLWRTYSCQCHRPFLGSSCQYSYSGATFGYENTTDSQVVIDIENPNDFKEGIELTMFIRTRQSSGLIFYLGKSDYTSPVKNQIRGSLVNGTLQVVAAFGNSHPEEFKLYSVQLDDGNRHFLSVIRMKNKMIVKVNSTTGGTPVSINQEVQSTFPIQAEKLYLGNLLDIEPETTTATILSTESPPTSSLDPISSTFLPPTLSSLVPTTTNSSLPLPSSTVTTEPFTESVTIPVEDLATAVTAPVISRQKRQTGAEQPEIPFFKGIIEDVRMSNGNQNEERIVELFELNFLEEVNLEPSLGTVNIHNILEGIKSDDMCRVNPCQNSGICETTWNDYKCNCQDGYKGEDCEAKEWCYWLECPDSSTCRSLSDGHECITNATFNGLTSSVTYTPSISPTSSMTNSISASFRSQTGGTVLYLANTEHNQQVTLSIQQGRVEFLLPEAGNEGNFTFGSGLDDGGWHTVEVRLNAGLIIGEIDGDGNEFEEYIEENSTLTSMSEFVMAAQVEVGSGGTGDRARHFKGCMREVRVGGVLLPFFNDTELVNSTAAEKFSVSTREEVTKGECVLCFQKECQNEGVCEAPSDQFQCTCPAGFAGSVCETNLDECEAPEFPCLNGVCVDGINNYTCACQTGWTGWLCNLDLDECEASPCKNGGTCTQSPEPGDYTCACQPEYKGKDCQELKVKTCREMPCQNGGTCIEETERAGPEQYSCDCPNGYEGINCEQQTDFCVKLKAECKNGGTCSSDFSSFNYNCQCVPGYEGRKCEIDIDECASTPCLHNGRCQDMLNDFQCDCDGTGYRGDICEINIDECLEMSPCQNSARCNDTQGSYHCMCEGTAEGYCGQNCHVEDPCKNKKVCHNGGQCGHRCDEEIPYFCSCEEGWEGITCNLKSSKREELALIVGPIVGGMAFIAIVGLLVFLVMARRKRRGEGHYRPAKQEATSPRLQLDNMLKIPPEERLI